MCVMSVVWCLFRFVAKVRSLDPSYRDVMPWQPRAYSRKRGREGGGGGGGGKVHEPQAKKLFSPLLAGEKVCLQKAHPCMHLYQPVWSFVLCQFRVGVRETIFACQPLHLRHSAAVQTCMYIHVHVHECALYMYMLFPSHRLCTTR